MSRKDVSPRSKSDGILMGKHDVTERRKPVIILHPKKEGTGEREYVGLKKFPELPMWRPSFSHTILSSSAPHSPLWPESSFEIFYPWFSEVCVMIWGAMKEICAAVWLSRRFCLMLPPSVVFLVLICSSLCLWGLMCLWLFRLHYGVSWAPQFTPIYATQLKKQAYNQCNWRSELMSTSVPRRSPE